MDVCAALLLILLVSPASALLSKAAAAAIIALRNASAPVATRLGHASYLRTVRSIVDFFQPFQAQSGAIIDPYINCQLATGTGEKKVQVQSRQDASVIIGMPVGGVAHDASF